MCAHAVRVAVQRIEGVAEVDVSLNQGVAVIRLRPENRVTVERVRAAIRDNGFTPKEAVVRVAGRVVESDEGLVLVTSDGDPAFALVASPDLPGGDGALTQLVGNRVHFEGTVPESRQEGGRRLPLEVRVLLGAPVPRPPGGDR